MKHRLVAAAVLLILMSAANAQDPPKPLVTGLENATAVAVGQAGKIYVARRGNKDSDGAILLIEDGKAVRFVTGLDHPNGLAAFQQWLFVADGKRVKRIDGKTGKVDVFARPEAFPTPPSLNAITVDPESGIVYVSDTGTAAGAKVYAISPKGKVSLVLDAKRLPSLQSPDALLLDGASHLLMADARSGELHRIKLADSSTERLVDGLNCSGLAWDNHGRLFATNAQNGNILVFPRLGEKPVLMAKVSTQASSLCLAPSAKQLLVTEMKAGTLTAIPITVPGSEVDETPLKIETAVSFPNLTWSGWKPETANGKPNPLRPMVLTHAGDGSNRVFVATEQGVVHVFPNEQKFASTKIFLDIQNRVSYDDKQNEEGLLGLTFHPKYKENGEFFVFYTVKTPKLTNVLSRFKVSKDDPDRADPGSEQELMRFTKPYWNHDGGTLCFGPDGYLYLTHGDGGLANDPHENGQNLNSLLGKVLRIDVDHKEGGKNYAVPKDNPFVGKPNVRPEIWAYGLRNIWRMAFDRKTGQLWAGDVGQNLYEEIDIITRGGNYGWNRREGRHPFGPKGARESKDFIEPIWEYHHDLGKCIIGGTVYRGPGVPALNGYYIYADYITSRIWALKYDEAKGRVVENRTIKDLSRSILSFGEDEKGEVYMLTLSADGKGLFRFVK
jgi:glucose/arabinose dehydrogenase/sugar lactone lactonase YvrE